MREPRPRRLHDGDLLRAGLLPGHEAPLEPRERFNVFIGDNGQGKTNLLEAIFVVATLRSFRTSKLADLVAFVASPRGRHISGQALSVCGDTNMLG